MNVNTTVAQYDAPHGDVAATVISAGGVIVDDQGRVVLTGRRSFKGRLQWGLPKGLVEPGEEPHLRGPAGALYDVVVDPGHRGRGVGRLLLDAAIAALAERGAPRVLLSTAERNEPAQRLFARAGFRRTMIEMTREIDRAPS